jgi:hypothetical protein
MSDHPCDPTSALRPLWWDDLNSSAAGGTSWLWRGYLAAGYITLLTSRWKAGKTTLVSVLLRRLADGGDLAGLAVTPAGAVVVSEEPPALWYERGLRVGFGRNVCWLCRPFASKPTAAEWEGLIQCLADLREEHRLDLAVIDPLASFLPGRDESSAGGMLAALLPLRRLTAAGMAVLLLHHPRKHGGPDGMSSRGSGALTGHADILIEMGWCPGSEPDDRRRRLRAFARFDETPPERVIELNAAGNDYTPVPAEESFGQGWPLLDTILRAARGKRTRQEVVDAWPPGAPRPGPVSVWRWLDRAVSAGRVLRDGAGTKGDPFLYWLPGMDEVWQRDPLGLLK